jgi:hypothetical protein
MLTAAITQRMSRLAMRVLRSSAPSRASTLSKITKSIAAVNASFSPSERVLLDAGLLLALVAFAPRLRDLGRGRVERARHVLLVVFRHVSSC